MVINYACPNCGADLEYSPELAKIHCGHCDYNEEVKEDDTSYRDDLYQDNPAKEYQCVRCGSVLMTEEKLTSVRCEYCGAPLIIADRLIGDMRPQKIIPFKISHQKAEAAFKKWCRNGRFTPKGFMSANSIKNIKGLYVPYWLFNMNTNVKVDGVATRVHIYRRGDTEYTETSFFNVSRDIDLGYANIPYDASKHLDDHLMATLEPYEFGAVKTFNMPYLSGYLSEQYDVAENEVEPAVKSKVGQYAVEYARGTVSGYSTVNLKRQKVDYQEIDSAYTLLPVWFFGYHYQGSEYQFMMNGQTGKVVGKPPISKGKVAGWIGAVSGVLFAVSVLILMITGVPV